MEYVKFPFGGGGEHLKIFFSKMGLVIKFKAKNYEGSAKKKINNLWENPT